MKSALGDNNNNDDELRATSADSVSIAVLHIYIVNTHIPTYKQNIYLNSFLT